MKSFILCFIFTSSLFAYHNEIPLQSIMESGRTTHHVVPGQPDVPEILLPVILPPGTDLASVRVNLLDPVVQSSGPAKIPMTRPILDLHTGDRAPSVPLDPDVLFPENWVSISSTGYSGEVPFLVIKLNPVKVSKSRSEHLIDGIIALTARTVKLPSSPALGKSAQFLLKSAYNAREAGTWYRTDDISDRLLVLVSKNLADMSRMLQPYADAMQEAGWIVKIQYIEEISDRAAGQALAEKIRECAIEHYQQGFTHLLLIGDPDPNFGEIPMKMAHPQPENLFHAVPTDLYYADLSGDWDLNKDNHYGTFLLDDGPGGVDFMPEIIVGRIPVYDGQVDQLDLYLSRVLYFKSWFQPSDRTFLLPNSIPFLPNEMGENEPMTDGAQLGEEFSKLVLKPAGIPYITLYEKAGISPSPIECDFPLTHENVLDLWKEGAGGVLYYGHGSPNAVVRTIWLWDDGDGRPEAEAGEIEQEVFFFTDDVWTINTEVPSFVFEVACNNGTPEYEYNISASLMRTGAIGSCGASRWAAVYGWETNFVENGSAGGIGYRAMMNLVQGHDMGSALLLAKADPLVDKGHSYWYANIYDYNLYGDPTVLYSGGQLHRPHPKPEVYWVNTRPDEIPRCPQDISFDVKTSLEDPEIQVVGADLLNASVDDISAMGEGIFRVSLSGALPVLGRQHVSMKVGATVVHPPLKALPDTLRDVEWNFEGRPDFRFVDITGASSTNDGVNIIFTLTVANDLPPLSFFEDEDFYAAVWWQDTSGDGWIDTSLRYYMYQGTEWALLVSEPDHNWTKYVPFQRVANNLSVSVPISLYSPDCMAVRWYPSAYVYLESTNEYTYQELNKVAGVCLDPGNSFRSVPLMNIRTGDDIGGMNTTGRTTQMAVIDPGELKGTWLRLDAGESMDVQSERDHPWTVVGLTSGSAVFHLQTDPLEIRTPVATAWNSGDSIYLGQISGELSVFNLGKEASLIRRGDHYYHVFPNQGLRLDLEFPSLVFLEEGSDLFVNLVESNHILPLLPYGQGFSHAWIPGVAHIQGALDITWISDLTLINGGPEPADLELVFHVGGWEIQNYSRRLNISGETTVVLEDFVNTLFGINGFGTLEIRSPRPIQGYAETYDRADPSRNQMIYPASVFDWLSPGNSMTVPGCFSSIRTKVFVSNPDSPYAEFIIGDEIYGLYRGQSMWVSLQAGTKLNVLRGEILTTLSLVDTNGQPAVFNVTPGACTGLR